MPEGSGAKLEDGAAILALDIGGTKIAWSVIVVEGERLSIGAIDSIATHAEEGGPAVAARIAELAARLVAGPPAGPAGKARFWRAVAVASAGVVDTATGAIVSATDTMPGWGGTRLGAMIGEATGLPVCVLNDVHAHGLAEARLGAGAGKGRVLTVAVGTGIGGALVADGKVDVGARGIAGHVGHIGHAAAAGMPCSCGRSGHIEAIASGSGLAAWYAARAAQAGRPEASEYVRGGHDVVRLAAGEDALAAACVEESAHALGECLGSLANVLDPEVIVLSGSVVDAGQAWWQDLRAGYRDSAMNPLAGVPLVRAELEGKAPLLGAALHLISRP